MKDAIKKGILCEFNYIPLSYSLTEEEKAKLFPKVEPVVEPSLEEKVQSLEDDNANLLFDLADKDVRLNQLENDFADLVLNLGGDK